MPNDDNEETAPSAGAAASRAREEQREPPPPEAAAKAPDQTIQPRPSKRRKNIRQTRVTAVDDDDDDDDDERGGIGDGDGNKKASTSGKSTTIDHSTLLEDTKALQKQRGKKTGIDTSTLLLGSARDRARASLAASGAASDAEALAASQRLSATEAALGNTFRGGGGGAGAGASARTQAAADAAADAEAERYVESRLAAALGRAPRSKIIDGDEGDGRGGRDGQELDRSKLYEPPREAKLTMLSASGVSAPASFGGDGTSIAAAAAASALEPRGAGLGGDDDARGAVGLVEVELSARDRLANIERTEAAKQRARSTGMGGGGGGGGVSFASSLSSFDDRGEGFRRKDLPTSFGGRKRR